MTSNLSITMADPTIKKCPYASHDRIRAETPAYRDPVTGMYLVTRFADVRRLALDTKSLSNSTGLVQSLEGSRNEAVNRLYAERGWVPVNTLVTADPPAHRLYRRLVEKAFTAKRVEGMHAYVRDLAIELIGGFVDRGEVEFVQEFAVRLPVMVIADQLGISRGDLLLFKRWSDAAIELIDPLLDPERELALTGLIIEMQNYFIERVAQLRRQPADHLFSDLVQAEVEGRRLDNGELCSVLQQLLVAGNETTTSTLGSAMILLIEEPGRADGLFERPEQIAAFVEEVLRLRSPVQGLLRRAVTDVDVGGVTIPKGAIVHLLNAAANHDPEIFANPHAVDLCRTNRISHMSFGVGIHHCIGAQLARAELNIAINEITRRMRNYRYVDGANSVDHAVSYTYAPSKVHFYFDQR